jgi:amino acid adenylation domain-containing protein
MATAVAGALHGSGAERGERVGILLERGRREAAALLGAWLAGAVPVPLEPGSPDPRNRGILERCGARRLLGEEAAAARLGVIAVPVPPAGDPGRGRTAAPDPDPEGEAILLHTSGSTGVPKGVPVTHAGVAAFVDWMAGEFGLEAGDGVAALAGMSFDLALFEQVAPLARGGTVLRPAERTLLSARALARFLDERGAAFVYAVPSLLVRLQEAGPLPPLRRLRAVLFAGETFPPEGLRRLKAGLPDRVFANLFGPTETNVCTFHRVGAEEPGEGPLPIGVPTPYAEVALVEEGGDAEAESGEICVRGPTVLRAYVGGGGEQPGRVVLPGRGPGPFLRTGDMASRGPDGLLRFRGRRDGMLKVRGYRVEPGEVEAVLAGHPGVADAAVRREVDPALGEVLVADVVAAAGARPGEREIRARAARLLPPYMVPARVSFVERLPLSARGKRERPRL